MLTLRRVTKVRLLYLVSACVSCLLCLHSPATLTLSGHIQAYGGNRGSLGSLSGSSAQPWVALKMKSCHSKT